MKWHKRKSRSDIKNAKVHFKKIDVHMRSQKWIESIEITAFTTK